MLRRKGDAPAGDYSMKKTLTTCTALAAVLASLASPAFAAPPKHRAPVMNDTTESYNQGAFEQLARPSDVVVTQGRVVGADPDANIRTQLLHDPVPTEY
jgi:hypothetical protein